MGSICFDSNLLGRLNSVIARLIPNDLNVSKHYCIANKTDIYAFLSCPRVQKTRFRCPHWEHAGRQQCSAVHGKHRARHNVNGWGKEGGSLMSQPEPSGQSGSSCRQRCAKINPPELSRVLPVPKEAPGNRAIFHLLLLRLLRRSSRRPARFLSQFWRMAFTRESFMSRHTAERPERQCACPSGL